MAKSFLNMSGYPLGLRNNNPGNIRPGDNWQGMIGTNQGFVVFENIAWGLRAMGKAIIHEFNVGNDTVAKLITEWAPPSENDTEAYISFVLANTGYTRNQLLKPTTDTLTRVMAAIIKYEVGAAYASKINNADILEGLSLINGGTVTPGQAAAGFTVGSVLFLTALIAAIHTARKSNKLRSRVQNG